MKSKTDVSGEFESSEIRKENADAPRDPYACISLPVPSAGYRHDAPVLSAIRNLENLL